jgi:hypothetical protein
VFISYRRSNISWALAIYQDLTAHGYDVFFDYDGIASGDFERVIIENITARSHFLVLLTPTALERCDDPDDWLRREIETALAKKRNIVPLMLDGFDFALQRRACAMRSMRKAILGCLVTHISRPSSRPPGLFETPASMKTSESFEPGERVQPPVRELPDEQTQALRARSVRREQLIEMLVMEENRFERACGAAPKPPGACQLPAQTDQAGRPRPGSRGAQLGAGGQV